MSLRCTETDTPIRHGAPLFVGQPADGEFICAISGPVLDRIPRELRRNRRCESLEDGLDIFVGKSEGEPTFRGCYQWSTLEKGDFLFSVSATTAGEYLPRMWAQYVPGADPTPPTINVKLQILGPPTGQPN